MIFSWWLSQVFFCVLAIFLVLAVLVTLVIGGAVVAHLLWMPYSKMELNFIDLVSLVCIYVTTLFLYFSFAFYILTPSYIMF
jgi:hypothetical protein